MKIAVAVEYCGTRFHGWQRLKTERSVQQCVEEALSVVADHPVSVVCAGRTDARVHALNQIIHFETGAQREMHSWVFGANSNLPDGVSLLWAKVVEEDFHARFSALSRSYQYLISNRAARPGIFQDLVTWESRPLDVQRMSEAGSRLLGRHDFTSYRAQACQSRTAEREIHELSVQRYESYVVLSVRANAFLYHMVRNIAGVLMEIGQGRKETNWAEEVLKAKNRSVAGVTAPPQGLYLTEVEYPEHYQLPQAEISQVILPF